MPAFQRTLRSTVSCLASGVLVALLASACAAPAVDAPDVAPTEPLFAKPAPGLTVSSTRPSYADRGTTVDVHVIGTGFVAGAQATWLLQGVADPAKVRTNSTTYVSSTEVVANVTVSSDADLAFWDVQMMAGGKNGVGTEVFEITTAEYLGPATFVNGMNEAGQIVGYDANAFVYDPPFGMLSLGAGQAWGIDPQGTMVFGRNGSNVATAWVRQGATSSFVAQTLPPAPTAIGGNATSAARDALGTLLVGGWQTYPGGKRNSPGTNTPAVWRFTGTWSAPTLLALPAGSVTGAVREINGSGQAVGRIDASDRGAIWDDPTTVTAIDGIANGINPSGSIAVGFRGGFSGQAVYWYRTTSGAWNSTGVALPTLGGTCGEEARGVNDAGIIVGKSCDAANKSQASVWRLDLSGPTPVLVSGPQRLPGLGDRGSSTVEQAAAKVSNTSPYVIAGTAASGGGAAVRWRTW